MENYFKSVFGAYDGLHTDTFKHIPEISYYNHNYYIGLKRGNNAIHDLLLRKAMTIILQSGILFLEIVLGILDMNFQTKE